MTNEQSSTPGKLNFRSAFCERFKCGEEVFEEKLLWCCLPPTAKPVAFVVELVNPTFFAGEFEIIRAVGEATDLEDIVAEANKLHDTLHLRKGFLRGTLRVRASGRRLVKVASSIWKRARRGA